MLQRSYRTLLKSGLKAAMFVVCCGLPGSVNAQTDLPKPYVSRALDVVLLPVTDAVRAEFGLGKNAAGAVVASVEPGGTGAFYGIEPGDVIAQVGGKLIRRPVDIDSLLRYGLGKGESFFALDGVRRDDRIRTWVELTQEEYEKPVTLDRLRNWRAFGGRNAKPRAGVFYYPAYWEFYTDYFYEVWDLSYVYIEEIIVTDVFIAAYESSDEIFFYDEELIGSDWPDDDYLNEVDAYLNSDDFAAEYASDEVLFEDEIVDDGLTDDEALGDQVADDGAGEEAAMDAGADDASAEDAAADEALADDTAGDEQAAEEPAAEEAYEEPVAEETYDEPAAEDSGSDGGSECAVDEDGNPLC